MQTLCTMFMKKASMLQALIGCFFIEEALSVQYDNVSSPFLYSKHIIHLDNLDKNF